MAKPSDAETPAAPPSSGAGGELARIVAVLGVNLLVVLLVVLLTSTGNGKFPDLNVKTLGVEFLPISAAMGLMLACRRLDLALPIVLALMVALWNDPHVFPVAPASLRIAIMCSVGAGVGFVSALVTWFGRISSALWTGLMAVGLSMTLKGFTSSSGGEGAWPWPAALAASLGVMVVGAALLGAIGLIALPSTPPIFRTGSKGLVGLAAAWMVAGAGLALASQFEGIQRAGGEPQVAYPSMLAAGALGGAYILRGRWGAVSAIVLTCAGHLVWWFAMSTHVGSRVTDFVVPAAAPLAAVPLLLIIDSAIRGSTGESAPTALVG
jgi:hypothetical protein